MEQANEVQGLKAWIEELTILAMVNSEQQGLPNGDKIEGAGENSKGQGQAPSTNMETIKVNYAKVIRKNQMLEGWPHKHGHIHPHVRNPWEGIDGQG